jgi:FkbM family methyltransferase
VISYAQNQEDVVLSRLLRVVPVGTFVDVGAAHPYIHNVTYWLYLAGWRGVNVEPMAREAELLRTERPDDTTLQVAVGAAPGTVTLFEAPPENRGATTSDRSLVDRYGESGQAFSPFDVEVVTLGSILAGYEPGAVHLVKIDVEGAEREVIAGADLGHHRPWVLVIEATAPNSTDDSSAAWEPAVVSAGYSCVLFDGLNRFYVRDDLHDIARLLSVPANVFDDWKSKEMAELELEIVRVVDDAAAQHLLLESRHAAAEAYALELEAVAGPAEEYVNSLIRRAEIAEEYALSLQNELQRITGTA